MEVMLFDKEKGPNKETETFKNLVLVFIVVFWSIGAQAQMKDQSDSLQTGRWELFKYDMGNVFGGIVHSYSRPLHWKGEEWMTLGAVVAGTGLIYLFDEQVSQFAIRQQGGVPDFVNYYGARVGSPTYNYMFTGGVYVTGLLIKDERTRRLGVLLLASASSAGLLQQVVKSMVGRARPEYGNGKDTFDPFNTNRSFHSFPSGHTILAFTNAHAIAKQFKDPWLKTGIYVIGSVPGATRLWEGQHWLTDIALGVAISIFMVESIDGYLDSKYDDKFNGKEKGVSWNIGFGFGQIRISGRF